MTQDEINVIESNAGAIFSGFTQSNRFSSLNVKERADLAVDYALCIHDSLKRKVKLLEQQEIKNNPNIPQSCPPESPLGVRW